MNRTLHRDNRRSWEAQVMGFGLYKGIAMLGVTAIMATVPTQAQTCEPHWSEQYPSSYLSGWPTAITIFDDGSGSGPRPYVGGKHVDGGAITLNNITQLNANNGWSPLGDGVDDFVFALTTFDDGSGDSDALYAVGSFTIAGKIGANKVAKWYEHVWSALGEGLDGEGRAVTVFDDGTGPALYVGGYFESAGGVIANNIAKWDGQNWSSLGDGTDSAVYALTVFDDGSGSALFAGGFFENAGGISAHRIAKWDGANWSPLGEGTNSTVRSLVVFDDGSGPALYAAGDFLEAGGEYARRIAKWDGISWSQVGTGISNRVLDLTVVDFVNGPALFAVGPFGEAGGVACSRIAKWDGKSWSPLGTGLSKFMGVPTILAITQFDDGSASGPVLLVTGDFDYADDITARNYARWDGKEWSTAGGIFPKTIAGRTFTVVEEGSKVDQGLYCGGYSSYSGIPIVVRSITHLKDGQWEPVGQGTSGSVQTLKHFDDGSGPALFVGGWFTEAGGMPANRVAKWDGNSWYPLGEGLDEPVMSMCVFDDGAGDGSVLYAGGDFKHSGDTSMYCIAKWDGKNWNALGQNINPYSQSVRTMIVFDDGTGYGDALYVGGDFFIGLDTGEFINIARWDGNEWSQVGAGSNSIVFAFAIYDDGSGPALHASGQFPNADGTNVNGLGRWDGKEWLIVPGGDMTGVIRTLQVFNDGLSDRPALYIGGGFDMVGSIEANRIARWDGKTWSALGSGLETIPQLNAAALAMAVFDDGGPQGESLYVTGGFLLAGGTSSYNFAQWIPCINPILGDLNGDGSVNTADLLILFANWGPCAECSADLDNDGFVGTSDLLILLSNWN